MGAGLQAALDRLTIAEVAEAAGRPLRFVSGSMGLCTSPFPEYHENGDKDASFFVTPDNGGKGWVNYAGKNRFKQKGGAWDFARECFPDMTRGELAVWLVDTAGTGIFDEKSPEARAAQKRKNEESARLKRLQDQREKGLKMPAFASQGGIPWPDFVEDRFRNGSYSNSRGEVKLEDYNQAIERLMEERGWPYDWCDAAFQSGLISRPLLPWASTEKQRGWAFPVSCPADVMSGEANRLTTVGYHQRYEMGEGKQWIFVPYAIATNKARTGFQKRLLGYRNGYDLDGGAKMIEPMPFVVGDREQPKFVIVTEGQWDALTIYGALGGFEDGDPIPVCVFGLRGVKNAGHFLRYWGPWLMRLQMAKQLSAICIIADRDTAGMALVKGRSEPGKLPEPAFKDVLERNLKTRVVCSWLSVRGVGKDFNDWYKALGPTVSEMWVLLKCWKLI